MIGKKVRFTTGTRLQEGVVLKTYFIPLTKTSQIEAASIQTATNLWSQIPLSRIEEIA